MNDQSTLPQSEVSPEPGRDFTAPLESITNGRLVFASGAAGVSLQGDPTLPVLYQAHFEQRIPTVREQAGVVSIRYRDFSFFNWLVYWRAPLADLTLNGTLPWEIEFREGVSQLTADLSQLKLRALDLNSASQVKIILPQPLNTVFIHISGSASNIIFQRPAGIPVRVNIEGGASNLALDTQRYGAAVGVHWQTAHYHDVVNRYDISVSGSVSEMTVG